MAYEDLNTKFVSDTNTNITELYPVVSDLNSIKQGLERLLRTPKGYDPFNREYGSSLYSLLFKNNANTSNVQMLLYMDITNWEPRITISPGGIQIDRIDNNTYRIQCNFVVTAYDFPATMSTTIIRE